MSDIDHGDTSSIPSVSAMHQDALSYYSSVQDQGLDRRKESPIYHSRNFNNWIKSILIQEYIHRLRTENPGRAKELCVFDMGCGKGGDIPKWIKSDVKSVVFADLAENLVEQCQIRFDERRCNYHAEFYTLNCTSELLRDKLKQPDTQFDLVSTQFVLHYSFESYDKANRFLRNAAESLRVGGYFIGTTVNASHLVDRCRKSKDLTISNDVYSIRFDESIDWRSSDPQAIPLFGAKYHFTLEEVVDCPEYLVYFPLLVELAKRHGLENVQRKTFREYFDEHCDEADGRFLLKRMDALKRCDRSALNDDQTGQFEHTRTYLDDKSSTHEPYQTCRSISKAEWDVNSLYITFAFRKIRSVTYDDTDSGSS